MLVLRLKSSGSVMGIPKDKSNTLSNPSLINARHAAHKKLQNKIKEERSELDLHDYAKGRSPDYVTVEIGKWFSGWPPKEVEGPHIL